MPPLTICTFNVENLFLRYKFTALPPGILSQKAPKADITKGFGYLPPDFKNQKKYYFYNDEAREVTALALTRGGQGYPGICCLMEVESMEALRAFNKAHLEGKYPYCLLIDSHDPRLIDIGVLSQYPISKIISHVDDQAGGSYLFSRDCLELTFILEGKPLTLFVNHLKSKYGTSAAEKANSDTRRREQAARVAGILKERFPGPAYASEAFMVLGDFNDSPGSPYLEPLVQQAGLENAVNRLDPAERWTHWWAGKNLVSQLDYLLLSPRLSQTCAGKPLIERRGLSTKRKKSYFALPDDSKGAEVDFTFPRFAGVTDEIDASDHCPVFLEVTL